MLHTAFKHLRNNCGDGYILFVIILVCVLLIFSTIFSMLTSTVELKAIYNQVENATNVVLSELKEESYKTLIGGTTDDAKVTFDNITLTTHLNNVLKGVQSGNNIRKTDAETGMLTYELSNVQMTHDSAGTITITFDIELPIYFNGKLLYTKTASYSKPTTISFKN